jgi:hypothetical protein
MFIVEFMIYFGIYIVEIVACLSGLSLGILNRRPNKWLARTSMYVLLPEIINDVLSLTMGPSRVRFADISPILPSP